MGRHYLLKYISLCILVAVNINYDIITLTMTLSYEEIRWYTSISIWALCNVINFFHLMKPFKVQGARTRSHGLPALNMICISLMLFVRMCTVMNVTEENPQYDKITQVYETWDISIWVLCAACTFYIQCMTSMHVRLDYTIMDSRYDVIKVMSVVTLFFIISIFGVINYLIYQSVLEKYYKLWDILAETGLVVVEVFFCLGLEFWRTKREKKCIDLTNI